MKRFYRLLTYRVRDVRRSNCPGGPPWPPARVMRLKSRLLRILLSLHGKGLCLKSSNRTWTGSVQGAVATWSNHGSQMLITTRSLPLPVLTRSKNDFGLLKQGREKAETQPAEFGRPQALDCFVHNSHAFGAADRPLLHSLYLQSNHLSNQ